jgi:hypothetical protein
MVEWVVVGWCCFATQQVGQVLCALQCPNMKYLLAIYHDMPMQCNNKSMTGARQQILQEQHCHDFKQHFHDFKPHNA